MRAEPLAPDLATVAAGFAARLRGSGIAATPERSARFASAIELGRPASVTELYWLARVTLVDRPDQFDAFDRVFALVFGGMTDVADQRGDTSTPAVPPAGRFGLRVRPRSGQVVGVPDLSIPGGSGRDSATDDGAGVLMTASVDEHLRHRDFAAYSEEELTHLRRLMTSLRVAAPVRRSRRTVGAATGRRLDVRRTLRRAHRTGADPVRREYRRRRRRPRRLVLIADISGSMEAYSRIYLQLLQGAVRGAAAEAFVLATRLTRVSRALAGGPADVAAARATQAAPDWSGGTRLGEGMKAFIDRHGRRGMARGAVVVIVSDGWERADPAVLAEQMARLRRLAHRVIWVNPRSAAESYEPLAGGMAAAMPFIDVLVSGHSLAALEKVIDAIAGSRVEHSRPGSRAYRSGL